MLSLGILLCLHALLPCFASVEAQKLPSFALDYAPLLYLHSNETHWPSDVSIHLQHVTPKLEGLTAINGIKLPLSDAVLSDPRLDASDVYLTSNEELTASPQPDWVLSAYGKPDAKGRSAAAVFCVAVDKQGVQGQQPDGDMDVFYFTFFSFSAGLPVKMFKKTMGSHLGDWEHSMVRFKQGKPVAAYVSRHGGGSAYAWEALEKKGKRPILYISKGSHATYAYTGHIDFANTGMVYDHTEKGVLWDPVLNIAGYYYHAPPSDAYMAADGTTISAAVLSSRVIWGDKHLPKEHPKQSQHAGFWAWASGPAGPVNKTLSRISMGPRPNLPIENVLPKGKAEPPQANLNNYDVLAAHLKQERAMESAGRASQQAMQSKASEASASAMAASIEARQASVEAAAAAASAKNLKLSRADLRGDARHSEL